MAERRTLILTEEQRAELRHYQLQNKQPQLQEQCAALLKIADGQSPHAVAQRGLLRPRDPDTIYKWLNTYEQGGLAALQNLRHGGPRRRSL